MKEAYFGQVFKPDLSNRADAYLELKNQPEYVQLSHKLRDSLKESIQKNGWPECPEENISSIEDFFQQAQEVVGQCWLDKAEPLLEKKRQDWLAQIPDDKKNQEFKNLRPNGRTCARRRRTASTPVIVEPAPTPVPPASIPKEVADEQAPTRVAINGSPEEDWLIFPFFRDKM